MNTIDRTSRILGIAFLLQAITSLSSGLILKLILIVPGNISESMINIAAKPWLMRANILGEMITALGIIFLGAILFATLKKQGERMALVALGFYILEGALLAASRIAGFSLLRISQEYVLAGYPTSLQTLGNLTFESMSFGYTLLMLPFGVGAMLFYYLLYTSRLIPAVLSLWGLVTVPVALAATLFAISGFEVPFFVYFPYVPFEFVVGVWILVKGIKHDSDKATVFALQGVGEA